VLQEVEGGEGGQRGEAGSSSEGLQRRKGQEAHAGVYRDLEDPGQEEGLQGQDSGDRGRLRGLEPLEGHCLAGVGVIWRLPAHAVWGWETFKGYFVSSSRPPVSQFASAGIAGTVLFDCLYSYL